MSKSYLHRKSLVEKMRGLNSKGGDVPRTKRRRSPRKLEPHEVVAMLKARQAAPKVA